MKTHVKFLAAVAAPLLLLPSCQDLFHPADSQTGTLLISVNAPASAATRATDGLPDIGSFLLTIADSSGELLYEGPYDHSPDEMNVPAGSYTISAVSATFEVPAFDVPQWGDTQVVTVAAGASVNVTLACRQLNCGLRLDIEDSFRQAFPSGSLSLTHADGTLPYAYDESRTAYFRPGAVSLILEDGGFRQTLFTRTLEARQNLSVRLGANIDTKSGGISIQLDTTRNWLSERFVVGGAGAGNIGNAYDVATARTHADEKGVWVWGYIVGVATNTGKAAFTPPFTKNTNLVLGTKASTSDTAHCLAVELKAGEIRDALNLADHPELLGRKLHIKGDLVSAYYGIPGLKAPSEYQLQ